jgi:hypothetical protein
MSSHSDSLHGSTLPSERTFGFVFTGIFLIIAGYLWYHDGKPLAIQIFLVLAIAFFAFAFFMPIVLRPLNKAWYKLGLLMGRVVSPIVLGILFFILISPIAIVMRLAGRDALKLRKQNVQSHWIDRAPPGPSSDSFKEQF